MTHITPKAIKVHFNETFLVEGQALTPVTFFVGGGEIKTAMPKMLFMLRDNEHDCLTIGEL